jgi:dephospho-CoA kinase
MRLQKKTKIALTGGIGTGKTFISKQFLDKGVPVFYADEEAKKLYNDEKVIAIFKEKYNDDFFTDNRLDLSKLATFTFLDTEKRKEIEAIVHPLVMQQFEDWATQQDSEMVVLESAIIFEAELEKYFDKIVVVDAPLDVRIQRVRDRNPQLSDTEIMLRIDSQMPQEEKCRRGDFVIWNG